MIIAKIVGGLGNQLFSYSFGRALAKYNNDDLALDISFYDSQNLRHYELHRFNIIERVASSNDVACIRGHDGIMGALRRRIIPGRYVKEKRDFFDESLLQRKGNLYLDGYWQDERYFIGEEKLLRKEFSLKSALSERAHAYSFIIDNEGTIALHIRRGDYITNKKTNRIHGTCGIDYYQRSMEYMRNIVKERHYIVFSDDISWVEDNLVIDGDVTYIEGDMLNSDAESLHLMSLCRHTVTANSSFSWWGAWLNKNPKKIIIAPQRWFVRKSRRNPSAGSWVLL